ncbi:MULTISPECIES: XdhC family protein [Pseudomonadati]|uniref:XdhC/CoxI family protein n=1 Tax=Shewanella aestuarii TaxID=1028752 RepID=A0ABT0KXR1_9GAMM|nr:XdhC/CoxI family protein [Shewanella aestuarii]MCL1116226.1 XdhC/CoxI family protein [Shewanella aestuarii]GGN71054.1 xanthine and CO dehydrogenase family maturation factor XdhC/CoxF family protein [Shewanella aestuarii]
MRQHLVDLLDVWQADYQDDWVVAILTHVQGSSYRKPGAIMFFHPLGKTLGMLSGGCLEADLRRHAQRAIQTQQVIQLTYDATDESDTSYQLGCGGIVNIMMLPLTSANHYLGLQKLYHDLNSGKSGEFEIDIVNNGTSAAKVKARWLVKDKAEQISKTTFVAAKHNAPISLAICEIDPPDLDTHSDVYNPSSIELSKREAISLNLNQAPSKDVKVSLTKTIAAVQSDSAQCEGHLIIPMSPPIHLGIFGGGLDAEPIAQIAQTLGWKVTIFDERTAYARQYDFPRANIMKMPCDAVNGDIYQSLDAAFVMNHNVSLDAKALNQLVKFNLGYIALLGPVHRRDRVLHAAQLCLTDFTGYFSAPAGLALGGELPSSVGLSILAQCHGILHASQNISLDKVMLK